MDHSNGQRCTRGSDPPGLEDSDNEEQEVVLTRDHITQMMERETTQMMEREMAEFLSLLVDDNEYEQELNITEEEEYITVDVAADSGAGDNVASKADAPGYEVKESAASRRGGNFVGAGGHRMKNQGEMLLHMQAPVGEEGQLSPVDAMFQVADVCRPLFSVSRICDKGDNKMIFDKRKAVVVSPKGKILCVFRRQGNLYIAQMKVKNPRHPSFGRQGK